MNALVPSLVRDLLCFAGGVALWFAIVALAGHTTQLGLSPVFWVMAMGVYIVAFAMLGLWVHARSLRRANVRNKQPTFMIPVVLTIVLMIFMVGHVGGNPAIWAMG